MKRSLAKRSAFNWSKNVTSSVHKPLVYKPVSSFHSSTIQLQSKPQQSQPASNQGATLNQARTQQQEAKGNSHENQQEEHENREKKAALIEEKYRLPAYLLNIPETQVTTLKNKFRIASEYRYGETATVGVWIDAGSVWENEQTNGVAHFLEHMAFKGTPERSQSQIEVEFENMGGSLNAYTSREQTVYYAHVFKKDIPKAVKILSDILTNSKFEQKDIERERGVILREMEEVESQTEEVIFDHLHSVAYQGTPLGYSILGPAENIKKISRDDLVSYVNTHYTAPRMVLVGAGAVDHNQLVELGNQYFGNLSSEFKVELPQRHSYTGSAVHVKNDALPLVHAIVAMETGPWNNPDYFVFMLLQTIVGSWDRSLGGGKNLSSRACEQLAREGLAHSLMSFNTCYNTTGLFGAYVVGERHLMSSALRAVVLEWTRIGLAVTEMEVERAKTKLKSSVLMNLDGTNALAEDIGRQILTLGRRMSPAEIYFRIDSIDYEMVRKVAYRYLYDRDPVIAAIGGIDSGEFPDYLKVRSWLYSLIQ